MGMPSPPGERLANVVSSNSTIWSCHLNQAGIGYPAGEFWLHYVAVVGEPIKSSGGATTGSASVVMSPITVIHGALTGVMRETLEDVLNINFLHQKNDGRGKWSGNDNTEASVKPAQKHHG